MLSACIEHFLVLQIFTKSEPKQSSGIKQKDEFFLVLEAYFSNALSTALQEYFPHLFTFALIKKLLNQSFRIFL